MYIVSKERRDNMKKDEWIEIVKKVIEIVPDMIKAYIAFLTYKALKEQNKKDSPKSQK